MSALSIVWFTEIYSRSVSGIFKALNFFKCNQDENRSPYFVSRTKDKDQSYRSRRSRKETWHQRKSLGNFWLQYEFNLKVTKNSQEGVEAKQRGSKCPSCMFPHCIWIPKSDFKIWYILSIVYVQKLASVIRITSDTLPKKSASYFSPGHSHIASPVVSKCWKPVTSQV